MATPKQLSFQRFTILNYEMSDFDKSDTYSFIVATVTPQLIADWKCGGGYKGTLRIPKDPAKKSAGLTAAFGSGEFVAREDLPLFLLGKDALERLRGGDTVSLRSPEGPEVELLPRGTKEVKLRVDGKAHTLRALHASDDDGSLGLTVLDSLETPLVVEIDTLDDNGWKLTSVEGAAWNASPALSVSKAAGKPKKAAAQKVQKTLRAPALQLDVPPYDADLFDRLLASGSPRPWKVAQEFPAETEEFLAGGGAIVWREAKHPPRCSRDGKERPCTGAPAGAQLLTILDGELVFAVESAVRAVPLAGGRARLLGKLPGTVAAITVDDDALYFQLRADSWSSPDSIARLRRKGGGVEVLADHLKDKDLQGFAVLDGAIYWTSGRDECLYARSAAGGAPQKIMTRLRVRELAAAAGALYWRDKIDDTLVRFDLEKGEAEVFPQFVQGFALGERHIYLLESSSPALFRSPLGALREAELVSDYARLPEQQRQLSGVILVDGPNVYVERSGMIRGDKQVVPSVLLRTRLSD